MKRPNGDMLWYPSISFISGEWSYRVGAFLYHYIPAYFIDTITRLLGRKPRMVIAVDENRKILIISLLFYV